MANVKLSAKQVELRDAVAVCRRAGLWVSNLPPLAIGASVTVSMYEMAEKPPGFMADYVQRTAARLLAETLLPHVEKVQFEYTAAMTQSFEFSISVIQPKFENGENTNGTP